MSEHDPSWKQYEARVLLVVHAPRHQGSGGQVRFMPDTFSGSKTVENTFDIHHVSMAVLPMGSWNLFQKARFGLPRVIMTDNGTLLVNDPFRCWCEKWRIKQINTAVAYPQANGLVERANKSLMHDLKARLGRERVGWVDELPNILWAHQTMLKTSNGETPFSMTYSSEAVIPVEIGMPTYRTIQFNEAQNEEEMRLNLDLIQEKRDTAAIREAKYKKKVEQYYNKRVRPVSFKIGDFVY
ncbi:reverse transcriptase domain-containing protein [Tanacetum coccineum]